MGLRQVKRLSGIIAGFVLDFHGLTMLIVILRIGSRYNPAEHGTCEHSLLLGFGNALPLVEPVGGFAARLAIGLLIGGHITFHPSADEDQFTRGGQDAVAVFRQG